MTNGTLGCKVGLSLARALQDAKWGLADMDNASVIAITAELIKSPVIKVRPLESQPMYVVSIYQQAKVNDSTYLEYGIYHLKGMDPNKHFPRGLFIFMNNIWTCTMMHHNIQDSYLAVPKELWYYLSLWFTNFSQSVILQDYVNQLGD